MTRPFIPAPNTASVEFIYQASGEVNENVIHVYKGSPFSLADLQSLRGVCNTWDNTTGSLTRVASATLWRIRTKALDTNASPMEDYYLPTPRPGTRGYPGCGLGTAFCVKLATARQGRSYRGRWYWGNFDVNQLADAGHFTSGAVSFYVAALATLKSNLAAAGYTWCVTSFRTDKAWRATAHNEDITTVVAVDNILDSMRRRLPGRGHTI